MTTETKACPRCGNDCSRDEVHNGVVMLYGPWGCECGWSEDERYDQQVVSQPIGGHVDQQGGFTPSTAEHDLMAARDEIIRLQRELDNSLGLPASSNLIAMMLDEKLTVDDECHRCGGDVNAAGDCKRCGKEMTLKCSGCGNSFPIDQLSPASASPNAEPLCDACANDMLARMAATDVRYLLNPDSDSPINFGECYCLDCMTCPNCRAFKACHKLASYVLGEDALPMEDQ